MLYQRCLAITFLIIYSLLWWDPLLSDGWNSYWMVRIIAYVAPTIEIPTATRDRGPGCMLSIFSCQKLWPAPVHVNWRGSWFSTWPRKWWAFEDGFAWLEKGYAQRHRNGVWAPKLKAKSAATLHRDPSRMSLARILIHASGREREIIASGQISWLGS